MFFVFNASFNAQCLYAFGLITHLCAQLGDFSIEKCTVALELD